MQGTIYQVGTSLILGSQINLSTIGKRIKVLRGAPKSIFDEAAMYYVRYTHMGNLDLSPMMWIIPVPAED